LAQYQTALKKLVIIVLIMMATVMMFAI